MTDARALGISAPAETLRDGKKEGAIGTFLFLSSAAQARSGSLATTAAHQGQRPFSSAFVLWFQQRGHMAQDSVESTKASTPSDRRQSAT